jgi:hypothetical protein
MIIFVIKNLIMKFKSKALFILATGIILVYAGCKKSSTPAVSITSPTVVASQLAVNLNESLSGGLGGFDIFDGLDATSSFAHISTGSVELPSSLKLSHSQSIFTTQGRMKQILREVNPLCGSVSDTTINESDTEEGLTIAVAGEIKFSFSCTNNILSGFNNVDNLNITLGTADTSFTYKVAENVTVAAVSPGVSNTNITLNGSIGSTISYTIKTGASKGSGTASFSYTFSSVVISPSDGIVSGSATFNTTSSGPQGTWNYSGTITFLGNGEAKITISGITYNVNLDTGAVG